MLITVFLTQKCTAECAHCCVSSGPARGEAVDADLALCALDSLAAVLPITSLHLVGGEPTLAKKSLLRLLGWAKQRNIEG